MLDLIVLLVATGSLNQSLWSESRILIGFNNVLSHRASKGTDLGVGKHRVDIVFAQFLGIGTGFGDSLRHHLAFSEPHDQRVVGEVWYKEATLLFGMEDRGLRHSGPYARGQGERGRVDGIFSLLT